jgi:hypothetical protein
MKTPPMASESEKPERTPIQIWKKGAGTVSPEARGREEARWERAHLKVHLLLELQLVLAQHVSLASSLPLLRHSK